MLFTCRFLLTRHIPLSPHPEILQGGTVTYFLFVNVLDPIWVEFLRIALLDSTVDSMVTVLS